MAAIKSLELYTKVTITNLLSFTLTLTLSTLFFFFFFGHMKELHCKEWVQVLMGEVSRAQYFLLLCVHYLDILSTKFSNVDSPEPSLAI